MAMPSGNVVANDGKSKFQPTATAEIHQPAMWFSDERDNFISWLRGEFAAANAIVDCLCHHLRAASAPGEYDDVIGTIQQRRMNWTSILHMQQYYPITEILHALKQVAWRRQHQHQPHHQRFFEPVKVGGKEHRRSGPGFNRQGQRSGDNLKDMHNSATQTYIKYSKVVEAEKETEEELDKCHSLEEAANAKKEKHAPTEDLVDNGVKNSGNLEQAKNNHTNSEAVDNVAIPTPKENDNIALSNQTAKERVTAVSKSFIGNERFNGKMVNVVDGMKLYENLVDNAEVKRLVSLVNDMRAAGKRGHFQGQTYTLSKRPMNGRGREMIQLGIPIVDGPLEDENMDSWKDRRTEAIPKLLQDVVDRLISMNITTVKSDSCVIDFFNEGDHSQPHSWPNWYRRPVCVLFLTECEMTFGRVIAVDHPGSFIGSLKLSLSPGSVLAVQGKSADFAKYAIHCQRKQRILITFTKCLPRKPLPNTITQKPSYRSPSGGTKYYTPISATNLTVLSASPIIPTLNGSQPLLMATQVAMAPTATWVSPPHPNVPGGTGVFLPSSGSGSLAVPEQLMLSSAAAATQMSHHHTGFEKETERSSRKTESNGSC